MNAWMLQIRGGVERDCHGRKAGKGALIQNNLAPCLGAQLDSTLILEMDMNEATQVCPINSMVLGKIPKADDRQTLGFGEVGDPSPTLSTTHHHAVAMETELQMVYHENGGNESFEVKGGAMSTIKSESDTTQAHNQLVLASPTSYIVRRLTPTECERLMGYPDHYTIPTGLQITDALVEEFQEIFANFAAIMEPDKPVKRKSDKQIRAWLEKVANPETCPDAPRYKCCGNGWAINSARWVLQGIDKFLRK